MPTEAQLTAGRVLAPIRRRWPRAWAWKVNERTRSGIPDVFVIHDGIPVFIEVKKLTRGQSVDKVVSPIQKVTLAELHRANEGRAIVVAFEADKERVFTGYLIEMQTTLLDYLMMVWG